MTRLAILAAFILATVARAQFVGFPVRSNSYSVGHAEATLHASSQLVAAVQEKCAIAGEDALAIVETWVVATGTVTAVETIYTARGFANVDTATTIDGTYVPDAVSGGWSNSTPGQYVMYLHDDGGVYKLSRGDETGPQVARYTNTTGLASAQWYRLGDLRSGLTTGGTGTNTYPLHGYAVTTNATESFVWQGYTGRVTRTGYWWGQLYAKIESLVGSGKFLAVEAAGTNLTPWFVAGQSGTNYQPAQPVASLAGEMARAGIGLATGLVDDAYSNGWARTGHAWWTRYRPSVTGALVLAEATYGTDWVTRAVLPYDYRVPASAARPAVRRVATDTGATWTVTLAGWAWAWTNAPTWTTNPATETVSSAGEWAACTGRWYRVSAITATGAGMYAGDSLGVVWTSPAVWYDTRTPQVSGAWLYDEAWAILRRLRVTTAAASWTGPGVPGQATEIGWPWYWAERNDNLADSHTEWDASTDSVVLYYLTAPLARWKRHVYSDGSGDLSPAGWWSQGGYSTNSLTVSGLYTGIEHAVTIYATLTAPGGLAGMNGSNLFASAEGYPSNRVAFLGGSAGAVTNDAFTLWLDAHGTKPTDIAWPADVTSDMVPAWSGWRADNPQAAVYWRAVWTN